MNTDRETEETSTEATTEKHLVCSSCGSDAPHHLAYVAEHGICVI